MGKKQSALVGIVELILSMGSKKVFSGDIEEMKRLRFEDGWRLAEIGKKYNISKERIRQLIDVSGFGKKATEIQHNRIRQMKSLTNKQIMEITGRSESSLYSIRGNQRHIVDGRTTRMGYEIEEYVSRKLTFMGITNKLMPFNSSFDILLTESNLKIEVVSRYAGFYVKNVSSPQYRFLVYRENHKKKNIPRPDYFILVINETKDMFVIPSRYAPNYHIVFCWPRPDFGRVSKWLKFHERFDLLIESK